MPHKHCYRYQTDVSFEMFVLWYTAALHAKRYGEHYRERNFIPKHQSKENENQIILHSFRTSFEIRGFTHSLITRSSSFFSILKRKKCENHTEFKSLTSKENTTTVKAIMSLKQSQNLSLNVTISAFVIRHCRSEVGRDLRTLVITLFWEHISFFFVFHGRWTNSLTSLNVMYVILKP